MTRSEPQYSMEEIARRGEAIFEREIQPRIGDARAGDFVLIDVETGAYEIDADELIASDRLMARYPDAQVWMRRVGTRAAYRLGRRYDSAGR